MHYFLLFQMPGMEEMIVIAVFGVIIFGKKLPEVGRSLGKGIVEFKKGLKGIDEEVERTTSVPAAPMITSTVVPQIATDAGHKFDPVTGQPLQTSAAIPPGAKFDPFTGKPIVEASETAASY